MHNRLSLDGDWQLFYFPEGGRKLHGPDDLINSGLAAIPAHVPGNIELDLEQAGVIPDPFIGLNIHRLRPLETMEWWYLKEFRLPDLPAGEAWDLVFAGLDTLATVWVNGVEVGRSDNMLIPHRFDVTAALKPGEGNRVAVRLGSALNEARRHEYDAVMMSWEKREEGLFLRKPPHCWGWDIMPRAVSAGIWRPVWLERRPEHAIEQVYYWTVSTGQEGAVLGVRFQFHTPSPGLDGFSMQFEGICGDHRFLYEVPVEFLAGGCQISIPGARLWWPKGVGDPALYQVTARLVRNGETLAERSERVGLRTLEVRRSEAGGKAWQPFSPNGGIRRVDVEPDPAGQFIILVNGEKIQARGTNWVPLDAFHSRDAERLEGAIALVDDLGCNMIRCWGGNVYESDRFFDLCDEKGILVWQDFAYACCRYPQTDDFLARVRQEVRATALRLRNHACLAIWCGDNEIDMAYCGDGLSPQRNRLTRQAIPETLQRFDPHRAYVPSSPYLPPVVEAQTGLGGAAWERLPEQHLWGPRGYFKSRFYTEHTAHFIGEIGYHGCPSPRSIRRFISPEKVWPWQGNEEWHLHDSSHLPQAAMDRDRIRLMADQVRELFGEIPGDLSGFALASQITQAEAKKFFVESARLRKWHTSGILWWNVLDGWPQFSDAVVDYYFEKKLAYYYIRRSQKPVCLAFGEAGSEKYLPLVILNDTRSSADVRYRVWEAGSGESLLKGELTVPPGQNWQAGQVRAYASDQRLILIEWETGGRMYSNHYLCGTPPFLLEQYCGWLAEIAVLPEAFDVKEIVG